jgi:hypothetical protein
MTAREKVAAAERATAACYAHMRTAAARLGGAHGATNGYGIYADRRGVEANLADAIDALQKARAEIAAARVQWPSQTDYDEAERQSSGEPEPEQAANLNPLRGSVEG